MLYLLEQPELELTLKLELELELELELTLEIHRYIINSNRFTLKY